MILFSVRMQHRAIEEKKKKCMNDDEAYHHHHHDGDDDGGGVCALCCAPMRNIFFDFFRFPQLEWHGVLCRVRSMCPMIMRVVHRKRVIR